MAEAKAARARHPVCVVEVGHPVGTLASWRDELSGIAVCDHHRGQYEERDDLGPYVWVRIDGTPGGGQ